MGFQETWALASADGNNDEAPPDGMHDVALVDAGAFTSKGGNDVGRLEFQTVDKQFQWTMILGFGSPKQAGFSKATCLKVGVNVDQVASLEELDAALKECCGGFYEVTVERNGEYVNTYVNEGARPTPPDLPETDPEDFKPDPVGDTADVPF